MKGTFWELKQSGSRQDALELYIYSTVEGDHWYEESETSANHFHELLAMNAEAKQIDIYINSLGGSVMEGIAIYNQLKRHSAHKTVHIDGFACSVASVIAMAGDEVIMPKTAVMMIHNAWTIAAGNAAELRKVADDLDVINKASRQAYLEKAGDKLTEEKLTALLDAETYLTADECLNLGLCDQVGEQPEEPQELHRQAEQLARARLEAELNARKNKAIAALNKYFG